MQHKLIITPLLAALLVLASCKSNDPSSVGSNNANRDKSDGRNEVALMNNFVNGNKEKILGNYELAINYFNKCLKIDENHAASLYELANIYEYQGKDVAALSFIQKAAALDPENVWYQRLLGMLYEKHGMFREAANVYEGLSDKHPTDLDNYYDLANAYSNMGDLQKAVDVFNRMEKNLDESEETLLQKQRLYIRMGNKDKAIEELQRLIVVNSSEARYYGMLADLYQSNNQPEEALATYKKLQELDPENPYVQLSLADYYDQAGEDEKAFEAIKLAYANSALEIDTKVQILLDYYARTETDDAEKSQAFELCQILVDTHPEEAKAHSIYGDFLNRDKQHKEAKMQFRKATELAPDKFVIWQQLLMLEAELRDWDAMRDESAEAMELFPSQPVVYLYNGIANIQNKEYGEAIISLESGKSLIIDNRFLAAQFLSNLGEAYNGQKQYAESDNMFEEALKLDPNNLSVLNNYAYYLSLRDDNLERAEELSKRANELAPHQPSYLDTYGWILYRMGNYEGAKTWIQKAMDAGASENDVILEHYGDVLFKLGNKQEALQYWNKARSFGKGSEFLDDKIEQQQLLE